MKYSEDYRGGHTFSPTYANCIDCHDDIYDFDDFDVNGYRTNLEEMLDDLLAYFIGEGWYDPVDDDLNSNINLHPDHAGAVWNYKLVTEDKSLGVHNPAYILALITNTHESLGL